MFSIPLGCRLSSPAHVWPDFAVDLRGPEGGETLLSLVQPILSSEVLDVGEFLFVIGDDGVIE